MKTVILSLLLVMSSSAFAKSNISGVWINKDQTLSVQIVDDPAAAPYVAGEIWRAMKGASLNKSVKTENFELKCSGTTQTDGTSFGSCKILVARDIVLNQGRKISITISKSEARAALAEFIQPLPFESVLIKSGIVDAYGRDLFLFEISWQFEMIASVMDNTLVTP